jgi:hypothetical protein
LHACSTSPPRTRMAGRSSSWSVTTTWMHTRAYPRRSRRGMSSYRTSTRASRASKSTRRPCPSPAVWSSARWCGAATARSSAA